MNTKDCVAGVRVKLKSGDYGCMRVRRVVPKKESGTTYQVVEVEYSSNDNFSFAIKKWFAVSDLVIAV